MAKRVISPRPEVADDLDRAVQEYVNNRMMRERSAESENDLKARLMDVLAAIGELQEGGHRVLMLDQPISYVTRKGKRMVEKIVTGIQRQKRVTTGLNVERTMAYLKEHKMIKECTRTEVVLDEDAVLAANYEGRISDEDMKALYDESENFAFYLVTDEP